MTEQPQVFDATRPSRTTRRYDRAYQELKYTDMVTFPMFRDAVCFAIVGYYLVMVFAVGINVYLYGGINADVLFTDDTARYFRFGAAFVVGAITMAIRGEHYQLMFYKNTKPKPTSETVESIVNPASPEIVPTRTISGHRIEFKPKTLVWRDKTFVLNRWQVKWFVDQYNNRDDGIRKLANDQWFGVQDIPDHPIRAKDYTLFMELCVKLAYIKKVGNENKVTDLWVIEILELTPPTRSGDSE